MFLTYFRIFSFYVEKRIFFKTDRNLLQVSGKNGYIENYLFQY